MKKIKDMILKKVMIVLTCFMLVFSSTANKCYAFDYALTSEAIAFIVAVLGFVGITCQNKTTYSAANELANDFVNFYAEACDFTREESIRQINRAGADGQLPTSGITGSIYYSCDMLREWAPSIIDWINENILPDSNLIEDPAGDGKPIFKAIDNLYMGSPNAGYVDFINDFFGNFSSAAFYVVKDGNVHIFFNNTPTSLVNVKTSKGFRYSNGLTYSTNHYYFYDYNGLRYNSSSDDLTGCPIFITGLADLIIRNGDDYYYYNAATDTITGGIDGSLELDPDLFNKDGDPTKYVIDFNPYFERYYDALSNSIDLNDKTIISSNATFNEDTHVLSNSGSIAVDLDKANDRVSLSDTTHSLVLDTDLADITDSTIADTYPDETIIYDDPTDYTADWTTVFPFCIPFDIFRFIKLLSADPEAPHFEWKYNFLGMKGVINVDLSVFDDVARICRNMQDLIFIVGLAMVTRAHLIKA